MNALKIRRTPKGKYYVKIELEEGRHFKSQEYNTITDAEKAQKYLRKKINAQLHGLTK